MSPPQARMSQPSLFFGEHRVPARWTEIHGASRERPFDQVPELGVQDKLPLVWSLMEPDLLEAGSSYPKVDFSLGHLCGELLPALPAISDCDKIFR